MIDAAAIARGVISTDGRVTHDHIRSGFNLDSAASGVRPRVATRNRQAVQRYGAAEDVNHLTAAVSIKGYIGLVVSIDVAVDADVGCQAQSALGQHNGASGKRRCKCDVIGSGVGIRQKDRFAQAEAAAVGGFSRQIAEDCKVVAGIQIRCN